MMLHSGGSSMFGPMAVDDSGAGVSLSNYTEGNTYLWGLSGHVYSSSASMQTYTCPSVADAMRAIWYQLIRSGTDWTGRWSKDEGATWYGPGSPYSFAGTITKVGFGNVYGLLDVLVHEFTVG